MTFDQWVRSAGGSDAEIAARLATIMGRSVDRSTVYRIRTGGHRPSSEMIEAILTLSDNAVDANTFFGLPPRGIT